MCKCLRLLVVSAKEKQHKAENSTGLDVRGDGIRDGGRESSPEEVTFEQSPGSL